MEQEKLVFELFQIEMSLKERVLATEITKSHQGWTEYMDSKLLKAVNMHEEGDSIYAETGESEMNSEQVREGDVDMESSMLQSGGGYSDQITPFRRIMEGQDTPYSPIQRRKLFPFQTPMTGGQSILHITPHSRSSSMVSVAKPPSKPTELGYQLFATKLKIGSKGLCSVLPKAAKIVLTKDWKMAQDEVRIVNVLNRVDELKEANLWTFKQLKKQVHPPRPKVQWDYMLEEVLWMSEDFKQEKRWKVATAATCIKWVLDWHQSSNKAQLCIVVKPRDIDHTKKTKRMQLIQSEPSIVEEEQVDELMEDEPVSEVPVATSVEQLAVIEMDEVLTVDPKLVQSRPITVDLDSYCYKLDSQYGQQQGLSDLFTYQPPEMLEGDMYEEDDSLAPISKFMTREYIAEDTSLWNDWGSRRTTDVEGSVKRLPSLATYHPTAQIVELFGDNTDNTGDILAPPNESRPAPEQSATGAWTSDEEDALWQFTKVYFGNWNLIADTLNGVRAGNSGKRTVWSCFEKYLELSNAGFVPHAKGDFLYTISQPAKKDKKSQVVGLLNTFQYILGLAKKRENSKPAAAKSNKQVTLAAHETHKQSQQNAGIDLNAPPKRPMELSRIKENREKLLEQTRQAQFQANHQRPIGNRAQQLPQNYRGMARPLQYQMSPQPNSRMAPNMTQEQVQQFLQTNQQRVMKAQGENFQFNPAIRIPQGQVRQTQQRAQLNDASTAAAYATLQNAQSKTSRSNSNSSAPTPIPSRRASRQVPAIDTEEPEKEPSPRKRRISRTSPVVSRPKPKRKVKPVSESEEEEEEEEEESEEDELESVVTSMDDSEPASPQLKKKKGRKSK